MFYGILPKAIDHNQEVLDMNKGVNYSMFYDILLNLREDFHSYGRIDDSNAKLDEMIKLICTSYSDRKSVV